MRRYRATMSCLCGRAHPGQYRARDVRCCAAGSPLRTNLRVNSDREAETESVDRPAPHNCSQPLARPRTPASRPCLRGSVCSRCGVSRIVQIFSIFKFSLFKFALLSNFCFDAFASPHDTFNKVTIRPHEFDPGQSIGLNSLESLLTSDACRPIVPSSQTVSDFNKASSQHQFDPRYLIGQRSPCS